MNFRKISLQNYIFFSNKQISYSILFNYYSLIREKQTKVKYCFVNEKILFNFANQSIIYVDFSLSKNSKILAYILYMSI
ncbi:hypothetical protein HW49_02265 [Porphyromonadaceae bacterium COT-184 OH4590]|nr:hypothetical protein HW49_02265 [Porphyromonadaceae bacterium COT-184 OH4590]